MPLMPSPSPVDPLPPTPARLAAGMPRLAEAGLVLVILLLAALLTFYAQPITRPDGGSANGFLRLDNLAGNVAVPMSWIAIMAVGVTCVIVAGGIDISVGSIFALSALGVAGALQNFPRDASAWLVIPAAALVALGIGGACGLINGLLVVGLRMHPFIVTLATLSIFRGLALVAVPTKSFPSAGRVLPDAFRGRFMSWTLRQADASGAVTLLQPTPVLIMLAVTLAGWVYLQHTVAGRQVYAVGGNEEAARFAGLPVGRIKIGVYVLSGLAAGVAGMVSAGFFGAANAATGQGYELSVIAAAVVGGASLTGGRGTALGAALGALIIQLIENGIFLLKRVVLGPFELALSQEYGKIIIGVAILLAVCVDRLATLLHERRLARRGGNR